MNFSEQVNTPDPQPEPKPTSRRAPPSGRWWRWVVGVGMSLLLLAMAVWWYLLSEIVPKIDQWRLPIAQEISRQLGGSQVSIGRMKGFSQGWRPAVVLEDVRIRDAAGREGLVLPRLTAQLSLESLSPTAWLRKRVIFHDIALAQPRVHVRRDTAGHWHVAGVALPTQMAGADESPALAWLMSQHQVSVQAGSVVWTDDVVRHTAADSAARTLSHVDIRLNNRPGWLARQHTWQLQATPPTALGQRLSVEVAMHQPWWHRPATQGWWGEATQVGDWRSWAGQVRLSLPWVNIQAIRAWWPLPTDVQGGQGALNFTLNVSEGTSQDLALSMLVRQVSVRLGDGLQPLAFKELKGTVKLMHEPGHDRVSWEGLSFITDEDLIWPASQASLEWTQGPQLRAEAAAATNWLQQWSQGWNQPGQQGRLTTSRVDLALLNRLADRIPLSASVREQLARLSPQGVGENIVYSWTGPVQQPAQYRLQGQLKGLSWLAGPEQPGLAGAAMSIDATRDGGQASLDMRQGWVEFPGAFEEPRIPVDFLKAQVRWQRLAATAPGLPAGLRVEVSKADFANADAQGSLSAVWRTGGRDAAGQEQPLPGTLDMTGRLSRAQGTRVWRYLPAVILQEARDYVRQAVRSGIANDVQFVVRGPLAQFPFKDNQAGLFRIASQVDEVELDYAPGWPAFTHLKGRLVFEGQGMRIEQATARLGTVGSGSFEVQQVDGRIPELDADDPVLTIAGQGRGPLDDVLRFMNMSPVGEWTGHMLDEARAQGQGQASLALTLPLLRIGEGTVKGQVSLQAADQADLRLGASVPLLQTVQGQVQFTQDSLAVTADARVWGQPVRVQGTRDAQGVPRFTATGQISADALKQATDWPALARLAPHVKGQTPVTVSVALARRKAANGSLQTLPELQVSSNLQGLALNLPAPLNKPAAAAWPVKLVQRADSGDVRADVLGMDLSASGLQIKVDYRREFQGNTPQVVRGLWHVVQGAPAAAAPAIAWPALPANGVVARVALPRLDTQAWEPIVALLQGTPSRSATPEDGMDDYLPTQVHFRAGELLWQRRTLRDVNMQISRPTPEIWRARVASAQVTGDIELRPDPSAKQADAKRVVAHLSRLSIPDSETRMLDVQATQQVLQPSSGSVPALDLTVEQFEWRGLPLGKLEVQAVNRLLSNPGQPATPEWRLTKFNLSNPDAQLQATGNWALVGAQAAPATTPLATNQGKQRAAFSFTLELSNAGGLLNRMGLAQTLKAGKGKLTGQLSWLGSPLSPDTASMNGNMNVALEDGQFLKADPGAAKLLGVLSLQSLPRRLILDFRDVFQQGFAFDKVEGDVAVAAGVAQTRNLRMRGVQALVLMEGQADLSRETQNLKVFVVPEINAGTASLAYAAINPAIGLGTFIAQVLLRKTVVEANTREFAITGTWADPKVDKVERSSVPAADAPAPSASEPARAAASAP